MKQLTSRTLYINIEIIKLRNNSTFITKQNCMQFTHLLSACFDV